MSKLSSEKRNRLNDSDFGIPEKRMYPLHDKAHIESAVRLFGKAENKYKRLLALNILKRAREYNMDTSGWKQILSFAQEQVPPMSDGTSLGNAPPRMMAPYYDEQDELLQRANSLDPNSKETMFDKAKRIVTMIHNKTEQDSKPPTGNQNCQLCTWCAEAQFRGMNVLPRPVYAPRDPALAVKGENIVLRPIRRSFTSQRDVVEIVRGAVDSRWYVHVNWAESTGGHEFLVVNLNDYAYIMDAQAGLLKEIDESDSSHNYFRDINFRNSYMVRLDDREFNTKLFNEMNDPSKVLPWNPELDVPYMKEKGMLGDMSDKWTMRPATESDLEFVYFSELETVGENKNDPKVQKYIREDAKESLDHTQIIVAENSDIGVYQAYATDYYGLREGKRDWWYLAHIYIKPEYRSLGIGSAIIKDEISRHDKILLQVMKSNPRAKKLYESLGFVVDMENDHGGLIMRLDKSKPTQESFMDEYAKRVNDKGDPVPEKCKCGGKVLVYLRGEPVYLCEKCGKYYGTLPCNIQEGAFQESVQFVNIGQVSLNYFGHSVTVPVETLADNFDYDTVYEDLNQMIPDIITKSKDIFNEACFEEAKLLMISYDEEGTGDNIPEIKKLKTSDAINVIKPTLILFDYTDSGTPFLLVDCEFKYDDEHGFQFLINKNIEITEMDGGLGGLLITDRMLEKPLITQEGAFQDLKNGVNPYSDNLVFHVTPDKHVDGQIWKPRVPDYLDPYNPEDTGFEDNTTPRICFSTSIEGALNGITVNLQRQSPDTFDKMYVYVPEKPWKEYKHKTNKQLVKDKLVYDANVTREVWIMEPVRMKLYGVIRVDQIADAKQKSVVPTSKGQKDTRNYFTYKWHWVVKPKVLKKATKFDYSPERVIDDLCIDVKKFKYGLIKDGRLQTGNVSDADYNKYWVFHSGETVDQAGGGNCYDMVEYEAGYLEAFGVPYKKYYMNFTDTKNKETIITHTICVVPHNGKFIYIEQAFKRVVDEWGYERKKVFDKLNDIFEYVAEVTAEYENQDLNYGVWDYTNAEIDYGTPIKNFMEWIMTKCKMIYDGEATKSKPVKEGFNLNDYDNDAILECDMFIELGDSMFYVSEYHNALFDDPDAHDEAINEFGILLDSYDDEIVQEAAYGPYDEYLKKHKYDPKTNTIEDPNRPGKRISAGKIGSAKERNRMNKFLRENGYDPKTETILTDINDKNNPGQKKRVPFTINPHDVTQHVDSAYRTTFDGKVKRYGQMDTDSINMTPKDIQKKPAYSNATYKHEEGHASQMTDKVYDFERDKPLWKSGSEGLQRRDEAKAHIDDMPYEDWKKIKNRDHDLDPVEYDADAYSELHNRYAKGDTMLRELRKSAQDNSRTIDRLNKDRVARGKHDLVEEARDEDEMLFAHQKRGEYAQQQYEKRQKQLDANATKQRQLSKEQLKQQIASGKLTGDQAAKAERKIQRIEAFEKQQAQNQPNPKTKPVKPQTTNTTPPPTSTSSSDKPLSVQNQSLTTPPKQEQKPIVKKEGYVLNRFKSRFFQEEEEELSDTEDMEDITIGDLNLDDETTASDDKLDSDDFDENGKAYDDENGYDSDDENHTTQSGDSENVEDPMELPGYMKERMSEDDVESFEQPDENLNADNVDLGQFGKDQSDVQNDYDQKEIDILMKLMASEADAMNEYMDGAKETNVDVLRRLYADIANEERFHMEQLLFAKSELTGEKYQPKDPEVKSEYEELLKMGMDEETAMQTAVDRCHIRGSISNDDGTETIEIQQDVEAMEMTITMFNSQFDNILMMMESNTFKREDLDHAIDVFVEATYNTSSEANGKETVSTSSNTSTNSALNTKKESHGPIALLKKAIGFLIRLIKTLIRKIVEFIRKLRNRGREFRIFIKRYGWGALFKSSKDIAKMYFVDLEAPACVSDAAETLLYLAINELYACCSAAGIQIDMNDLNTLPLKRDPRYNVNGNVERGIQLLNGVQLIKSKMVIPADEEQRTRIAKCFFGFTIDSGDNGLSDNTLNKLKIYSDQWTALLNKVDKMITSVGALSTQTNSIYYKDKRKYSLVIKGLETIVKTAKAVIAALQNDINVMMQLNNDTAEYCIQKTANLDKDLMNQSTGVLGPQRKYQHDKYNESLKRSGIKVDENK